MFCRQSMLYIPLQIAIPCYIILIKDTDIDIKSVKELKNKSIYVLFRKKSVHN